MSQDFSTWSRDDFNAFDAQRTLVFQPTAEELAQAEANKQAQLQALIVKVQGELSQYGITFLGTETDFKDLYTQYIIGAPDMREQF
jgi:competence protein ComGF